jgi:hypothetical protein
MTEMSEEARAVANVLLAHHREVCRPVRIAAERMSDDSVNECTLTYGVVCERAKMPDLTHIVGRFMEEIAWWCADHGWPPLNSLAVNGRAGYRGEGTMEPAASARQFSGHNRCESASNSGSTPVQWREGVARGLDPFL